MNRIGPTFVLAGLLLAGCSHKNTQTANAAANASTPAAANTTAPVAENVKGAVRLQPGEWSNNYQLTNFYAPGIKDQEKADGMRDLFVRQIDSFKNRCLTPEESTKLSAKTFTDAVDSGTCTYDRFLMQNGKIDAALACIRDDHKPGPALIIEGSYTPTSFDFHTITQMPNFASPGSPAMMVTAHIVAHRIGPCHSPGAN